MFEAYVTNLGLYPERGAGAGEYLKFPTTVEEVQALFSRIGIDGKQYEEYFITDYDSDILGLTDHLVEYESLDELNYLAHLLEEMTPAELEKLEAVMDAGEYTSSVKDLINLTQNLDFFDFYSDVNSEEELGRMYIQDFEAIDDDESGRFFDRSAYSRMMEDVENGKIGVCIMKDLTRWGRDYLQVGNAMEVWKRACAAPAASAMATLRPRRTRANG